MKFTFVVEVEYPTDKRNVAKSELQRVLSYGVEWGDGFNGKVLDVTIPSRTGARTSEAISGPTCTPTSDWGCEAREKLGRARGAIIEARLDLEEMRDALDHPEMREEVTRMIGELENAEKETAQPQPCSETARLPSAAAVAKLIDLASAADEAPDCPTCAGQRYYAICPTCDERSFDALSRYLGRIKSVLAAANALPAGPDSELEGIRHLIRVAGERRPTDLPVALARETIEAFGNQGCIECGEKVATYRCIPCHDKACVEVAEAVAASPPPNKDGA